MSKKKRIIIDIAAIVLAIGGLLLYWDHQVITPNQALDECLRNELAQTDDEYVESDFAIISYRLFKIKESKNKVDVYGMFFIERYQENDDTLVSGYFDYMKVTMNKDDNQYKLDKVWVPEDGNQYTTSLLKNFPISTWSRILWTGDRYRVELMEESRQQYNDYINQNISYS